MELMMTWHLEDRGSEGKISQRSVLGSLVSEDTPEWEHNTVRGLEPHLTCSFICIRATYNNYFGACSETLYFTISFIGLGWKLMHVSWMIYLIKSQPTSEASCDHMKRVGMFLWRQEAFLAHEGSLPTATGHTSLYSLTAVVTEKVQLVQIVPALRHTTYRPCLINTGECCQCS